MSSPVDPKRADARLAARRSAEPSPDLLDTLAAAYAAAARFHAAIETAARAAELVDRAGDAALAASIHGRLALNRSDQPYLESR